MIFLKSLQAWCFSSEVFGLGIFQEGLDSKSKELLEICQDLRINGFSFAEVARLSEDSLLDEHTKSICDELSDDIIIQLGLLTWHFDATSEMPSSELLDFLRYPNDKVNNVCQTLCGRYTSQTERKMSCHRFQDKLLYSLGFVEYVVGKKCNLMLIQKGWAFKE